MTTKGINTKHILLLILLIAISITIGVGISQAKLRLSKTKLLHGSKNAVSVVLNTRSLRGDSNARLKRLKLVDGALGSGLKLEFGLLHRLDAVNVGLVG